MSRAEDVMAKIIQYGRERGSAGYYDCAMCDEGAENCYLAAEALEAELRALVGEMERDAARYRWLRGHLCQQEILMFAKRADDVDPDMDAAVEKAIDAAMEAANVPDH